MNARHRAQLVFHGAVILVPAFLAGFLSVSDEVGGGGRSWESVHSTLILMGVWLIATGAAAEVLELAEREARGLVWSLSSAGYALVGVLVIRAATGVSGFEPSGSAADWTAFLLNMIVVTGSILAAFLTISGARNALRKKW
jgi:hypothetical protein